MTEPLEPLPPSVASLLEDERRSAGLEEAAKHRLRRRLTMLGPVTSALGAAGGGSVSGLARVKAALLSKIGIAALAFGAGAAAGAGVDSSLSRPRVAPVAAVSAPAIVVEPPPFVVTVPSAGTTREAANVAPVAVTPKSVSAPRANREDRLRRERTTLEAARTAITRQEFEAALVAIDRHAREFPRGQLAEERELLRIQALAGEGRVTEAKERAEQFRRDFPGSLMQGAIDAVVQSIR